MVYMYRSRGTTRRRIVICTVQSTLPARYPPKAHLMTYAHTAHTYEKDNCGGGSIVIVYDCTSWSLGYSHDSLIVQAMIVVGLRPRGPSEGRNGVYECRVLGLQMHGWIVLGQRSGHQVQLEACTHVNYDSCKTAGNG